MSINELILNRFGLETETGNTVAENKTLADILSHRSCRNYKPDPIPEDLLQTLFAAAQPGLPKRLCLWSGVAIVDVFDD
jgi:hypothetical protein